MNRLQKEECVSSMRQDLQEAHIVIVACQNGLTVGEMNVLRQEMRNNAAHFKVMKNTLARRAVVGTALERLVPFLSGPTALAYSVDPVGAAKALVQFAEGNEKVRAVGAMLDGTFLDQSALKMLASLPSLDALRAQLLRVILAPATKIARILQEPGTRIARLLASRT